MKPLNPVMAALLAASSAAVPPGMALAAEAAGTCSEQAWAEKSPVNAVACLIDKDSAARAEVGERFASFLKPELAKDDKALAGALAEAKKWAAEQPAGRVAELYFVMGPQADKELPSWVKADPLLAKTFKPGMKFSKRLVGALKDGKIAAADGVKAFLDAASAEAAKILNEAQTQKEITLSVGKNETTDVKAPPARKGSALDGAASGFEFADLYEKGAYVVKVYGPKDDGYRTLSFKMCTVKDDKNNLQNMIGIVDITDPSKPYATKYIPMTQEGDTTFSLRGGGRQYTLSAKTVDGAHRITLKRPGAEDGEGAATTSIEELAKLRASQAAEGGSIVIGEKEYYVLGQGGQKGSALFFPKELIDGAAGMKDPRYLRPVAMADLSRLDADGLTVPVQGKPDLGRIEGKPYHLEFDNALKIWRVTSGAGDPPAAPLKPAAAASRASDLTALASGGKEMEGDAQKFRAMGFRDADPGANDGFDPETEKLVRIMLNPQGKPCFVFHSGLGVKDNQFCPLEKQEKVRGLRGFEKYGVIEFENSTQYLSLDFFAKQVDKPSGIYAKNGMTGVTDIAIAIDILKREQYSDDDLAAIIKRCVPHMTNPYLISSDKTKREVYISIVSEAKTYRVWPTETEGEASGSNAGYENNKGPGTAVDLPYQGPVPPVGLSLGPDAIFPTKIAGDKSEDMSLQKTSQDGAAAVYLLDDPDSKEKKWFILVKGRKMDGAFYRSGPALLFSTNAEMNALPAVYELQGYPEAKVPNTAKLGLVIEPGGKKGVVSLYRYEKPAADGSNIQDKEKNTVGPVLWWGASRKEALRAGKSGRF
ncbi:MAG TPA: hypothetical protein DCZ01_12190 [Elusimicrobia bacterium]|nr:MAG: hypothetical protein A2X37_02305 [Elusimicrobia bacterium GWA2_66_18]HAZ09250.1 hypothetical protein [Elusimicrobiota bacterium]